MKFTNIGNGIEILGSLFGVQIVPRKDAGPLIQLLSEDDGHWSKRGDPFDSFWLKELIALLSIAEKTDMVRIGNKQTVKKIRMAAQVIRKTEKSG